MTSESVLFADIEVDDLDCVEPEVENETEGEKKRGSKLKSCWRKVERLQDRIMLLKSLREIDPSFDPESCDDFKDI